MRTDLMFEYHDATALNIDEIVFDTPPAGGGGTTTVVGGGFPVGDTVVQGVWTAKQKKKLFVNHLETKWP